MFSKSIWPTILALVLVHAKRQASQGDINRTQKKYIVSSINSSAEPCENFYAYACGDYAELHSTKHYQEITTLMDYKFNNFILNLLDSAYQHDHQVPDHCQSFVEKTRVYLKACRRETKRQLTRYFEQIKPGPQLNWPILEQAKIKSARTYQWPDDSTFDAMTLLGQLQSYGLNNALINQEILVNADGSLSLMMEPAYSENNSTLPDLNILFVLLKGLGVSNIKPVMMELVQTNQLLLGILSNYSNTNEEDQEITYAELDKQYPALNLSFYLSELVGRALAPDTSILLRNPSYFLYLNDNLWQTLEKQQLCNYLMMKFLFFLAVDSTAEFKSLDCVKDLRNKMDLAVNFLYYHHNYARKAPQYNEAVYDIFQNIRHMFAKYFQANHLKLTPAQVEELLDKLRHVRLNIGNLPDQVTFELVEEFYEHVPALDKDNYYKNHLLLLKHRFQKSLHYAQNQTHFIATDNSRGSLSGAFYVPLQNMVIVPFGSLQLPLYDVHLHDLYKYSLLGFILAHEITHAFDTTGLNFDGMGNALAVNSDIVDNANFKSSLECMSTQLATESIDERIADIVAIQVVYKIYSSKYNDLMPAGMEGTWNKDFYLNLAQFFCGKSNVKFIDHDTDAQRLHQIVINSGGFAPAFQCAENTKMNPSEKCRLY